MCRDMGTKGHVMVQGVTGAMLPQARGQLSPQKLEEAREDLPWSLWRECGPANTLISDFQPPELWENKCSLFLSLPVSGMLLTEALANYEEKVDNTKTEPYLLATFVYSWPHCNPGFWLMPLRNHCWTLRLFRDMRSTWAQRMVFTQTVAFTGPFQSHNYWDRLMK